MLRSMQYYLNFLNSGKFDCSLLLLTAVPNAKPLHNKTCLKRTPYIPETWAKGK